tara:strand:+ start:754 stop:1407 length:654 start_codon:yes stop_codon:yes gene_type:complete
LILNIYKPSTWTSFDVVKKIKIITKEKKVGHAGTLDPFAEGVLMIGTNIHTKKLSNISRCNKTYIATIKLGIHTDSFDRDGKIIKTNEVPTLNELIIKSVLQSFIGPYKHLPPMYSAKKKNGIRLYNYARNDIIVERDPIKTQIEEINFISFDIDKIKFSVKCSSGTYIRSLAVDISKKLKTIGHLVELIRTEVGEFSINDSLSLKKFEESWKYTKI